MNVHLELESEEYGVDTFSDYPTMKAAVAGFKRLVKKARQYASEDGIARKVSIVTKIEA